MLIPPNVLMQYAYTMAGSHFLSEQVFFRILHFVNTKWFIGICNVLKSNMCSSYFSVTTDLYGIKHRQTEIRLTSSLNNVICPQQFQPTDHPFLKGTAWIGCFPRFLDCSKPLQLDRAPSVYHRCRTAPAPF